MSLLSPQLQAFLAVARRGTVQQAAHDLKITQTGVTQRIKGLESQLGAAMFTRSRRGMRLTTEGEGLLLYCQRVLELEREALVHIEGRSGADKTRIQRVTIAGPSSMMRARIIPACAQLGKLQTQLRFTFLIDDGTESVKDRLRRGVVHFGVLPVESTPAELDHKQLAGEVYMLAVPHSWKQRSLAEIVQSESMIDFDENDAITRQYLKEKGLLPFAQKERHFANNTDALASMIAEGLGYSLMAADVAKPLIKSQLICDKGEATTIDFTLCWYPRPEMSPYLQAVLDVIR